MAVTDIPASKKRLDLEDYETQIDAAERSMVKGHYAAARAELRGAILILEVMEKRDDE